VNTDRTIRIGNNRIPKHFLSKERTCAKKETLFAKQKAFTKNNSFFSQAFFSKKKSCW
jgi:hypothetical protein